MEWSRSLSPQESLRGICRGRGYSSRKSTFKAQGHLLGEEAMGSFNMKTAAAELAGAVHSSYPLPTPQQVQG